MGETFRFLAQYQPPPPEGAGSPLAWGTEEHVRELLGADFDLTIERRMSHSEDDSLEASWSRFSKNFGPVRLLLDNLPPEEAEAFTASALEHFGRNVQPDGRLAVDREYLLVTGERRQG